MKTPALSFRHLASTRSRQLVLLPLLSLVLFCTGMICRADGNPAVQTGFHVKYVMQGSVYLDAGSHAGLAEGQKLTIKWKAESKSGKAIEENVAELEIVSIASNSAVCEIRSSTADIKPGDVASLTSEEAARLQALAESKQARKYPQVIEFTQDNTLDEEVREHIPRPPLPEINRIRGRFGFEYNGISNLAGAGSTSQYGVVLRADMTRIGGSYWNLRGFYRGRLESRTSGPQQVTLNDLVNRTYNLVLSYDNPNSKWVGGIGRFYLPWASSLDTIDGGYLGRRMGKFTLGLFGGSAPDPTSWRYSPNRQMVGTFINHESGSFESFRHTSTFGIVLNRIDWHPDRQFAFFENGFYYKHSFSVYHNLETDMVSSPAATASSGVPQGGRFQLSRSYLTVRYQPLKFISFDVSDNYFRNVPTFDTRLIGMGLLDKYLFQGLSGGVRVDLPYHLGVYTNLGRSRNTGDTRASLNEMFGVTMSQILKTGIRADFRYSKFDSSFGRGLYRSLDLSRQLSGLLGFDLEAGQQNFASSSTAETRARFVNASLDWFLSRRYFLGVGASLYRGGAQNYNQWFLNLGYRFSSK